MNDVQWDKKLKIHTTGRDDYHADDNHHPYEPTPYSVLEKLAASGYIQKDNHVTDYGSGKGRVGFFLHHEIGCKVTGIEFDERIWNLAMENLDAYGKTEGISNLCVSAEDYKIQDEDRFYFFNPFSEKILLSVLGNILDAYYQEPKEMYLFFYYPDDAYVSFLMTQDALMFVDEIDCQNLFDGKNERERILIFEVFG